MRQILVEGGSSSPNLHTQLLRGVRNSTGTSAESNFEHHHLLSLLLSTHRAFVVVKGERKEREGGESKLN